MSANYSLQELAELTGSQVQGDASYRVAAVASVEQAQATDISYIRGGKYRHFLQSSQAGALILTSDLAADYAGNALINRDPYLAYAKVVTLLYPTPCADLGIHPSAVIADDVVLGDGCTIGAHAVLESGVVCADGVTIGAGCVIGMNSRIGEKTRLYPNVTLGYNTQIGQRGIIHAGAVVGADGFGFAPNQGTWYKIPQIGNVVIGDEVEIGANTTIDRAAMGSTYIGNGVKLDNLIQVAHNVQIGDYTAIAGCTAIAGSTRIGRYCRIAGMCAITGHLQIADHVTITATTFVTHSITQAGVYSSGTTIAEAAQWRKNAVRFNQLDTLARRLVELEKQLAALQNKDTL
ncbi:MAG: UDP-3-O-(3-hydroxymyristoyl)glucosamine N-acyltransferase [Pseudomonadota bacterium]|jgi:UDP-3-O-[3-hydroxymyristoyl] glucosamine N-acyltransferase